MKCLIIAAGQGTRLKSKGEVKPLVTLLGVPLIERVIRSAMEGGVHEFVIITGYQGKQVRNFCQPLAKRLSVEITLIQNDDWKKENLIKIEKRLNGWQLKSFKESYKHKLENGISLFKKENQK